MQLKFPVIKKSSWASKGGLLSKINKALHRSRIELLVKQCGEGQYEEVLDTLASEFSVEWVHFLGGQIFIAICEKFSVTQGYYFKDILAKKIIESILIGNKPTTSQCRILMSAMLHLEQFDEIGKFHFLYYPGIEFDLFVAEVAAGSGREAARAAVQKLHDRHFSFLSASLAQAKFRDKIEGKHICVVGPAATTAANGKEIDEYDLVARVNFTSPDNIAGTSETHGRRTDISYINGVMYKSVNKNSYSILKNSSFSMVFRNSAFQRYLRKRVGVQIDDNMRTMPILPKVFGSNVVSVFGIQRIILDLMLFKPAEIYIFNADFFTQMAGSMHASGYKTAGTQFYEHDLLYSFRITRYLYNSGLISGDGLFKHLMTWTDKQYLERLDEVYVDPALFTRVC